jgi:tetratricopeptide (TPR) repeat protein
MRALCSFLQVALPALLLTALILPARASAQSPDDKISVEEIAEINAVRKVRRGKSPIRSRISRYLSAAAESFEQGEPEKGRDLLDRLKLDRLNTFERANVYKLKAYMEYGAVNYPGAAANFENVLGEEILRVKDDTEIRFSVAQLHAAQQQWPEAITALERWFRYVQDPDPIAYYLLAIAYYQLEDFDNAIINGETAVDLSADPKEGWLQLLAALYVRNQDYAKAGPIFEELVMRFPKKEYWVQLSLIYGARDDYRQSLAVQQIAYQQGLLTEDKELLRLARSYLFKNLPYPAARVLSKGLEEGAVEADPQAYELLANAWIAAREYDKSIDPLSKAAELAEDGRLFVRLAQVYMQREDWGEAANLIEKALAKGGFDDKKNAQAQLLLGISYYNAQSVVNARSAFRQARVHEATREQADAWIAHLARESQAG